LPPDIALLTAAVIIVGVLEAVALAVAAQGAVGAYFLVELEDDTSEPSDAVVRPALEL
jgi:hypothetical protein